MKRLRAMAKDQGVQIVIAEGGRHTKVMVGERMTVIPRHNEINEVTARAILKQMGVEP